MDTPLAIITYIAISDVIAILLLVAAPTILLDYGLAIAWVWLSILTAWIGIESLHADFEDEQEIKRQGTITGVIRAKDEMTTQLVTLSEKLAWLQTREGER